MRVADQADGRYIIAAPPHLAHRSALSRFSRSRDRQGAVRRLRIADCGLPIADSGMRIPHQRRDRQGAVRRLRIAEFGLRNPHQSRDRQGAVRRLRIAEFGLRNPHQSRIRTVFATDFSRWLSGRYLDFLSRLQPGFSKHREARLKPAVNPVPSIPDHQLKLVANKNLGSRVSRHMRNLLKGWAIRIRPYGPPARGAPASCAASP